MLGSRLRPFTLWHWLLLEVVDSPFVEETESEPTFEDLQIAVHICTHRPLAKVRSITPGKLRAAFQRTAYRHGWRPHARAFRDYVTEALKGPRYFEGPGGAGFEIKTSVPLYLVEALMERRRFTEREAWSTAPGLARWYRCVWNEVAGKEQIFATPRDVEIARECGIADYALD